MTGACSGVEHLATQRSRGHQQLHHGLRLPDIPRCQRGQPLRAAFVAVQLVEIRAVSIVGHTPHATPDAMSSRSAATAAATPRRCRSRTARSAARAALASMCSMTFLPNAVSLGSSIGYLPSKHAQHSRERRLLGRGDHARPARCSRGCRRRSRGAPPRAFRPRSSTALAISSAGVAKSMP